MKPFKNQRLKEDVLKFLEKHPPTSRNEIFQFKGKWKIMNLTLRGINVIVFEVQEGGKM